MSLERELKKRGFESMSDTFNISKPHKKAKDAIDKVKKTKEDFSKVIKDTDDNYKMQNFEQMFKKAETDEDKEKRDKFWNMATKAILAYRKLNPNKFTLNPYEKQMAHLSQAAYSYGRDRNNFHGGNLKDLDSGEARDYLDKNGMSDWSIDHDLSNSHNLVALSPEGKPFLAAKGTNFKNFGDIKFVTKIAAGKDKDGERQMQTEETFQKVSEKYGAQPDVTGHSAGGTRAMRLAKDNPNIRADVFNPGVGKDLWGSEIANITSHSTTGDPVSVGLGRVKGATQYNYRSNQGFNPIAQHGIKNFTDMSEDSNDDEPGELEQKANQNKRLIREVLTKEPNWDTVMNLNGSEYHLPSEYHKYWINKAAKKVGNIEDMQKHINKGSTFTEWLNEFQTPNGRENVKLPNGDSVIHPKAFHRDNLNPRQGLNNEQLHTWAKLGGEFTDGEVGAIRNGEIPSIQDEGVSSESKSLRADILKHSTESNAHLNNFALTNSEMNYLVNASPEERDNLENRWREKSEKALDMSSDEIKSDGDFLKQQYSKSVLGKINENHGDIIDHFSIETPSSFKGEFKEGAMGLMNPKSLGIGMLSGAMADQSIASLNKMGFKIPRGGKGDLSSSIIGDAAEGGLQGIYNAKLMSMSGFGGSMLSDGLYGAVGSIAGDLTHRGLDAGLEKLGMSHGGADVIGEIGGDAMGGAIMGSSMGLPGAAVGALGGALFGGAKELFTHWSDIF